MDMAAHDAAGIKVHRYGPDGVIHIIRADQHAAVQCAVGQTFRGRQMPPDNF